MRRNIVNFILMFISFSCISKRIQSKNKFSPFSALESFRIETFNIDVGNVFIDNLVNKFLIILAKLKRPIYLHFYVKVWVS